MAPSEARVPSPPRTRIVVADAHPIVREGLRRLFEHSGDMELVGEADDATDLVALCRVHHAHVLLLDASVPGPGFLETLRVLRRELPELWVLVTSEQPEERVAPRALEAGAVGCLSKKDSPQAILEAIRRVRKGSAYISDAVANRIAARVYGRGPRAITDLLSPREYQIFLMLGQGASVTQIANTLGLSPKTVSTHRARILEKTKLSGNTAIIRFVLEHQLVE
jgi:two-component system invasion response regulator UvrY